MVNVKQRMRKLITRLLDIKIGPGAIVLPTNVTKLQLEFAKKINNGHAGARKFWRHALPRLKYHNPAIPIAINRSTNQEGPATLTVSFGDPATPTSSSTRTPSVSPATAAVDAQSESSALRTEVIDVKHLRDSEILARLTELTNATHVNPTSEDQEQLEKLQEQEERSRQDEIVNTRYLEKKRQENALLAQARGAFKAG